jgi:hypothetical protein
MLVAAIGARLPDRGEAVATIILDQWQGSLLWWSFDPGEKVEHHVERPLKSLLALIAGG